MKRYVEPDPRARQLFFLALAVWALCAVLVARLNQILPPLSSNIGIALDQGTKRLLLSAVLASAFYAGVAFYAVRLTRRSILCGQWPPVGMSMPFRTAIREIRHPGVEWFLMSLALLSLAGLAALPWLAYAHARDTAAEISALSLTPNPSIERTCQGPLRAPCPAAHVKR